MYDRNWRQVTSQRLGGKPQPRPPGTPTPCSLCPKGPEPFKRELSPANKQAHWYYLQCKVDDGLLLPRDETTIRNNALIRMVEDTVHRTQLSTIADLSTAIKSL